jgi:RNA polymerase sigma factor for flagellar operon FliA
MSHGDEGDESTMTLDVVPDRNPTSPHDKLTQIEVLSLVTQRLSDQEYRVLYLRYWEALPMREIGELTGLSESRVCKIHAKLIERLQDRFRVHLEEL